MNPPSFIIAGSVIFWSWQTGLLVPAVIMAVVLALSSWLTPRWDFSTSDFDRISDLCVVLFLGMLVYAFASNRSKPAILVVLQWLPLSFFPLIASQIYSRRQEIDLSSLFLLMRIESAFWHTCSREACWPHAGRGREAGLDGTRHMPPFPRLSVFGGIPRRRVQSRTAPRPL